MKLLTLNKISLVIILIWLLPNAFTKYTPPDQIGVRRSVLSGINEEDFNQGRAISIPILHSWYMLPRTLHYLEFRDKSRNLDVRTRNNNLIHVDITVIYRIMDGKAHLICREGLASTYPHRVKSVVEGFLLKHLGQLNNEDIQDPRKRNSVAKSAITPLNERLKQYHIEVIPDGVVIAKIAFEPKYENRLQAKQVYAVQGELDAAKEKESRAKQATDTVQKGIDRDVAIEEQLWNERIELAKKATETEIAAIVGEAEKYDKRVRSESDATYERKVAEGVRAEDEATALGQTLESEALSSKAGRTYSAIQAVEAFEMGEIMLNSLDPTFMQKFASMNAWRRFFLAAGE